MPEVVARLGQSFSCLTRFGPFVPVQRRAAVHTVRTQLPTVQIGRWLLDRNVQIEINTKSPVQMDIRIGHKLLHQ